MRYIVTYHEDSKKVASIDESPDHETLKAYESRITWDTGVLEGLRLPYVILAEQPDFDEGDTIQQSHIDLDISEQFKVGKTELERLQERLAQTETALDFLMGI